MASDVQRPAYEPEAESAVMDMERVKCDEDCGALVEPGDDVAELQKALEHWRFHECLAGCAHGC